MKRSQILIKERKEWLEINGHPDADYSEALEDCMSECGKLPDGSCMLAGTEHCDWDCPLSAMDEE